MDRRAFLASLGAAVVAPGCAMRRVAARAAEPAPRPNVVMVLSDDHTKTDTGCYGSTAVRTPHIDRLAREGMRFRNAFTATAMCVPSRATLYTGLYPMRHGAWPNHSRVFDGARSLPHLLEPLGYRTAIAGKTHFRPASGASPSASSSAPPTRTCPGPRRAPTSPTASACRPTSSTRPPPASG